MKKTDFDIYLEHGFDHVKDCIQQNYAARSDFASGFGIVTTRRLGDIRKIYNLAKDTKKADVP
jgi:hypothetical protein